METTLIIDEDILSAAKDLAARNNQTVGEVISALSREALKPSALSTSRSGFPLLPMRDPTPVTLELVNRLRDELPA